VERATTMVRDPHEEGLLAQRLQHELPDPPGRVGREARAAARVEASRGLEQSEVPFRQQVLERHAEVAVLFRDLDHERQVILERLHFCSEHA
jgi:hypothetical protein